MITLEKISPADFDGVYDEMECAFPREERRDREAARAVLTDNRYSLCHVIKDRERVGFLGYWALDGFTFLEHLAIFPQHRNKGIGGDVIAHAKQALSPFLLECEPPETEIAARRLAFYRRCGLLQNDHPYIQPSYHGGEEGVPLILMSYPTMLTNPDATVRAVYASAYGKEAL